jgi:hypothetical protein
VAHRSSIAALLGLAPLVSCATYDRVGRPPSPAEVERINAAASWGHGMKVMLVEPLAPCAHPGCPGATESVGLDITPSRVEGYAAGQMVFVDADGRRAAAPLEAVVGVEIPHANRARTAAAAAAIAAGSYYAIVGMVWAISNIEPPLDNPMMPASRCPDCKTFFITVPLVIAGIGAVAGAYIGSPQRFLVGGGAL